VQHWLQAGYKVCVRSVFGLMHTISEEQSRN
jgi:hypothetical protein